MHDWFKMSGAPLQKCDLCRAESPHTPGLLYNTEVSLKIELTVNYEVGIISVYGSGKLLLQALY